MARLCILREDLYLELRGMVDKPIPDLDECSSDWREIYFFRNSVRTLLEIRGAAETIRKKKAFMQALAKQPHRLKVSFDKLASALNLVHALIRKLRNEVGGGHVSQEALEEALTITAHDTKGLLQLGDKPKELHYKFALEFIGAAMLRHVSYQDAQKEWQRILESTFELSFKAIKAIDLLFVAYSRIYNLRI